MGHLPGYRLKNYYTLSTLLREVERFPCVAFEIFDTLLLPQFLPADDPFPARAEDEAPVFAFTRTNLDFLRSRMKPNPLMKKIYDRAAGAGARIFLVSLRPLPADFLAGTLHDAGIPRWEELLTAGETDEPLPRALASRAEGGLLYLGQHDPDALREAGITVFRYIPPIQCYLQSGGHLPDRPWTPALSERCADTVNRFYTRVTHPAGDVAVRVENVSMLFNISSERIDNIKEYCIKLLKRQLLFEEFWALQDVSFEVRRGERVGLIGLNGSGKSTMLKIVCGVLRPTKGRVEVTGTVAPLIELGAGFDFDLSAKENVFLGGAILGYPREEMRRRYESIIDFAGLHGFENVPIKNYSSGMIARLGFAIATCHTPDVLIIDEILSVGDFEFQKKCHRKMEELTGRGTTVLFVSHSAGDIVNMCDRAIWLDHGRIVDMGEAEYIVGKYLNQ